MSHLCATCASKTVGGECPNCDGFKYYESFEKRKQEDEFRLKKEKLKQNEELLNELKELRKLKELEVKNYQRYFGKQIELLERIEHAIKEMHITLSCNNMLTKETTMALKNSAGNPIDFKELKNYIQHELGLMKFDV